MALESIALIPSGVKATKVYSQLPVNGNGDFSFDRGTSTDQTRVNKNGLIESVAQDVPRLDYLDGGCPSLLLEPATTNLITYSEDFSNVAWVKGNTGVASAPVVTTNQGLSPDGSVNADRVVFDLNGGTTSSALSQLFQGVSGTASIDYHLSIYIKSFDGSNYQLELLDAGGTDKALISVTPEWQRFDLSTNNATTTKGLNLRLNGATTPGTADILVWGAQVEQQSYATSYARNLTTGGGVRNTETCDGAGTTAEINSQEGVLFVEMRSIADDGTNRVISLSDGGTLNRVSVFYSSSSNVIRYEYRVGGTPQCGIETTLPSSLNYSKVAIYYKENDFRMYVNGLLIDIDSSGSVLGSGVLNELSFFAGGTSLPFYGRVKKISVYDQALSTTELETLTGFTSFAEMSSYLSYS